MLAVRHDSGWPSTAKVLQISYHERVLNPSLWSTIIMAAKDSAIPIAAMAPKFEKPLNSVRVRDRKAAPVVTACSGQYHD